MISKIYKSDRILFKAGSRKHVPKRNIEKSIKNKKDKKKCFSNSWKTSTKENQSIIDSLYHKYSVKESISKNEFIEMFINKSSYYTIIDIEYLGNKINLSNKERKELINKLI